jgi:BolA protein
MTTAERIESRLQQALAPTHLEILDESGQHVGHAGAAAGGSHFSCVIVSEAFRGRSTLERHRAVYQALGDLLKREVHALAVKTLDPTEWAG